MNHFHVTLPSDSSLDTYPGNRTSRFTTKLADRIELGDDYEVGLSELIYPRTWINFDNSNELYYISIITGDKEMTRYVFKSGYYEDGIAFATDLNRQVHRALLDFPHYSILLRFTFNPTTLKMTMQNNSRSWVILSHDFYKFLGFTKVFPSNSRLMHASEMLDLNRGNNLMYIYCDAASHSIVGDVEAPLLRVCNIKGKFGETVRTIFTHPHYVPVARSELETIDINISDELGQPISFMYGKLMVTLHFRPRLLK